MNQATTIMLATCASAGVALLAGAPAPICRCPEAKEIVRYFPAPEPSPVYPAPKLMPVGEIGPPKVEERKAEPTAADTAEEEDTPRHERRARRHHSRRHWRRH